MTVNRSAVCAWRRLLVSLARASRVHPPTWWHPRRPRRARRHGQGQPWRAVRVGGRWLPQVLGSEAHRVRRTAEASDVDVRPPDGAREPRVAAQDQREARRGQVGYERPVALNQRLANPLLHLLDSHFGMPDREVGLLDVHRGKLWRPTAESRSMDNVLRMQAAAFLVGWEAVESRRNIA